MKKISTIVMALLMVLPLSQCKKNEQNASDNQGDAVTITLDVKDGNGSKVVVNPNTGTVDFENGDQIIVASGGKYVGTLTYNGNLFTGAISNATEGYPLQFYFLGNVTPAETLTSGVTESCSVVISDQTEHLPVISTAPSNENYAASTTDYTAHLLNKCALVKFNVTTTSEASICVTGFNNKVTVNFMENTLTNSQESNGVITLPAGNGEKWAILLPQEAMGVGIHGSAYSQDGVYNGTCGNVPTISNNSYLTVGIEVNVSEKYIDLGLPSGTLWATCNVGANTPEDYGNYFAWGEIEPKGYYDWNTYQYCNGSNNTLTKYCSDSNYGYNGFYDNLTILLPEDDAATTNWGEDWRMPTWEEWNELRNNTTCTWTTQNGVNGRLFTALNGNSLFMPAAGNRLGYNLGSVGSFGFYWSSSLNANYPYDSWLFDFNSDFYYAGYGDRHAGQSVRPVLNID